MIDESELNELYRYAIALSQDSDEAYDLIYSSIEKYLVAYGKHVRMDNKMGYLKRSIRNAYFDVQRHYKIRAITSASLMNDYRELQNEMDSLEQLMIKEQACEQILQTLNAEERELVFLWAVEGYTAKEIAELQGGGRGTWLSRIHRIKQRLREKLDLYDPPKQGELG